MTKEDQDALSQYLTISGSADPPTGTVGRESSWLPFTELQLTSGKAVIGDATYIPDADNCLVVDLPAGRYAVLVKVLDYGSDKRISRLRVAMWDDSKSAVCGDEIAATSADSARTGVGDYAQLAALDPLADDDKWKATIGRVLDEAETHGVAQFDAQRIPFVVGGFGDGEYPVFSLTSGGRNVGVEVQFIEESEPYPF